MQDKDKLVNLEDLKAAHDAHFPATGKLIAGTNTTATGNNSTAVGYNTTAASTGAHAEGLGTTATGSGAHAEGSNTSTNGVACHAEGNNTVAQGAYSHAEGVGSTASQTASHAEGDHTQAIANYAHAEGWYTIANRHSQHVFGDFNEADPSNAPALDRGTYVEIVGNGTGENNRSNARTLDWNGNETLAGDLTINKGKAGEKTVGETLDTIKSQQALSANAAEALALSPNRGGSSYGPGCNILCVQNRAEITWRYLPTGYNAGYIMASIAGELKAASGPHPEDATISLINSMHGGFTFTTSPFESGADYWIDLYVDATQVSTATHKISLVTVSANDEITIQQLLQNEYGFKGQRTIKLDSELVTAVRNNLNLAIMFNGSVKLSAQGDNQTLKVTWNFRQDRHESRINRNESRIKALEDGKALSASAAEALAMSPEEWNQSFGNGCTISCKRNSTQITWRYSDMVATPDQYAVIAGTRGVSTSGTLDAAVADLINTQHAGFAFDETPFDVTEYNYFMDLFVDASAATSVYYNIWLATVSENGVVSSLLIMNNDHLIKHQLQAKLPAQFVQAVRTNKNLALVYGGAHRLITSGAQDEKLKLTWNFRPDRYESRISAVEDHFPATGRFVSGTGTVNQDFGHAEGFSTTASGYGGAHAEGSGSVAGGVNSHAEGYSTTANGNGGAHAEGNGSVAGGNSSHAEGYKTTASGNLGSHAEGEETIASGEYGSHAEGWGSTASGNASHAEGYQAQAIGTYAHAEGFKNKAEGEYSHAEGKSSWAQGESSHAEGSSIAKGKLSHSEGTGTQANGDNSHAEGSNTNASGKNSHAEGLMTGANRKSQHVFGEYNVLEPTSGDTTARGTYVEIVGNGTARTRSNARTLDWNGNESLAGSLTLGKGTTDEVTVTAAQMKQLLALLS